MPANVLSPNNATFEASIGNWVGWDTPNDLTRVTTPTPHAGSGVLRIANIVRSATLPSGNTPLIPHGDIVTVSAWCRQSTGGTMVLEMSSSSGVVGPYFTRTAVVPTSSWQQIYATYVTGTFNSTGPHSTIVHVERDSASQSGIAFFLSDVSVSYEPVNPPTELTAIKVGGEAHLAWTNGALQTVDLVGTGLPSSTPFAQAPVSDACLTRIERRVVGGSWGLVTGGSRPDATETSFVDNTIVAGVDYEYRVRYAITNPHGVAAFSAYSNVAPLQVATGGWGVGMVRMGSN